MKSRFSILLILVAGFLAMGSSVSRQARQEEGAWVHWSRGVACFGKGDIDGAIAEFNHSVGYNINYAPAYYHRAKAYEYKKDLDRAIADYTRAVEINPGLVEAYYYRVALYTRKDLFDEAIADYTDIIEMDSASKEYRANAYNNRGLIYHKKGRYYLAIDDFTKATELIPRLVNAYYNRACVHLDHQEYDLALRDFEKELSVFP